MSRSKFAVLRIEDDSDAECTPVANKNTAKNSAQKGKTANKQKSNGGLIIHTVERQRPKNKKNAREKVIDATTGYVIQDAMHDMRKQTSQPSVVREASSMTSSDADNQIQHSTDSDPELDIQKFNLPNDINQLAEFYRDRFIETTKKLEEANEEIGKHQSKIEHIKQRYKLVVELLRDSEVSEKAKLVQQLEVERQINKDLTSQITQITMDLEQARTRLRIFEAKK